MKRLFAAAAVATMVLMAAPAGAQQYPPAVNSLTVSDTTPTPGQTIGVEGRTFADGSTATVTLSSEPVTLGTAVANGEGVFTVDVTIPEATPLGRHTITATGQAPDGSDLTLTAGITVVASQAADVDTPAGTLPRTGDDSSLPLARIGLALAAIGGIVTAIAAKRRKALASPA